MAGALASLVAMSLAPLGGAPQANPVVDWTQVGAQAVFTAGKAPCAATLYMAMMHVAI